MNTCQRGARAFFDPFFNLKKKLNAPKSPIELSFWTPIQAKKKIELPTAPSSSIFLKVTNALTTSLKMSDTKVIAMLKAEVAALKARVEVLEDTQGSEPSAPVKAKRAKKERDPTAPKKEANNWIKFTMRVNEILKAHVVPIAGSEQKQFCALLRDNRMKELGYTEPKMFKAEDYDSIGEDAVLTSRKTWVKPEMGKWAATHPDGSRKSSTASETKEAATEATKDAEAPKKKRGRPAKKVAAEEAKAPAPAVVVPSEEAGGSDDEEEEVIDDVTLVTINGKEYYKSEFNDLFDSDTMEYKGLLNGKKILNVPIAPRVAAYLKKANM